MKVKELLKTKKKWCQGSFAYDKNGDIVNPRNKNAVCWCLVGAVQKCYPGLKNKNQRQKIYKKIEKEIESYDTRSIPNVNDDVDFKFIKKLIDKLDI